MSARSGTNKHKNAWSDTSIATRVQRAAMLSSCRKTRFIDLYCPLESAREIVCKFFGPNNLPYLNEHGLKYWFDEMKKYVDKMGEIGSILYRIYTPYTEEEKDIFLCCYTTKKLKTIKLTLQSVCEFFIKENYSGNKELDDACLENGNTKIYLECM
jgi:hypothetical protein